MNERIKEQSRTQTEQTNWIENNNIRKKYNERSYTLKSLIKAKIHYTSFLVTSPQQVGNFFIYGEVMGKRV